MAAPCGASHLRTLPARDRSKACERREAVADATGGVSPIRDVHLDLEVADRDVQGGDMLANFSRVRQFSRLDRIKHPSVEPNRWVVQSSNHEPRSIDAEMASGQQIYVLHRLGPLAVIPADVCTRLPVRKCSRGRMSFSRACLEAA